VPGPYSPEQTTDNTKLAASDEKAAFSPEEQKVAQITYGVIRRLESQPQRLPSVTYLQNADVQAEVLREVAAQ
jgi:type III restriction enzyme